MKFRLAGTRKALVSFLAIWALQWLTAFLVTVSRKSCSEITWPATTSSHMALNTWDTALQAAFSSRSRAWHRNMMRSLFRS